MLHHVIVFIIELINIIASREKGSLQYLLIIIINSDYYLVILVISAIVIKIITFIY